MGAEELAEGVQTKQVILAYDGSAAAEHALGAAARLLVEQRALVLVVWKAGLGFEMLEIPSVTGLPPAPIDIGTGVEIDEAMYERAQRLAEKGRGSPARRGLTPSRWWLLKRPRCRSPTRLSRSPRRGELQQWS